MRDQEPAVFAIREGCAGFLFPFMPLGKSEKDEQCGSKNAERPVISIEAVDQFNPRLLGKKEVPYD